MKLSEYVQKVMDDKGLSALEVERRSNNKITDGHVQNIQKGKTTNLNQSTLLALAEGLGVDPVELFKVSAGLQVYKETWTPYSLVKVMNILVDNAEMARIVQALIEQKPAKIKAMKKLLEIE